MNPIPELSPQLKQLRLSGILDSLEARNRQAIESKLAYTEFLALLIGDEIARREQKKFGTRLRRAQFRTTKTLEQFDFTQLPSSTAPWCMTWPPGAMCRNAPRCSSSGPAARASPIWPRRSGTVRYARA
jgi:hypothetical protein